jgi:pyruvate/2-oxoacid:ferredoxin oxidoreductase beta subunit
MNAMGSRSIGSTPGKNQKVTAPPGKRKKPKDITAYIARKGGKYFGLRNRKIRPTSKRDIAVQNK